MKIHHIGYAVTDIEKALHDFLALGFVSDNHIVNDETRKVRIAFVVDEKGNRLELVAPSETDSPISGLLKNKGGATPYHICFETTDIVREISTLKPYGFKVFTPIKEAPAIGNQRVCFLFSLTMGLIELVETRV